MFDAVSVLYRITRMSYELDECGMGVIYMYLYLYNMQSNGQ